jgi:hypothetical protein
MKGNFKLKTVPKTTNNITKAIVNFLDREGHCAVRIERTGIWDRKRGFFRKSGTLKAVLDIHCTLKPRGATLWVDTKNEGDKASDQQIDFANDTIAAGGFVFFAKDAEDFYKWYHENKYRWQ